MQTIRINHPHNEASALVGVQSRAVLDAFGWDVAFWIVSDERNAAESVAALGRSDEGKWSVARLEATPSSKSTRKKTQDCETIARAGSWMYVFGSHYGAKEGPLDPTRHFVLRFNESLVVAGDRKMSVGCDVVRHPFLIHRLINDAIQAEGIDVLPVGEHLQHDLIDATRKLGSEGKKRWRDLVRDHDLPINIEGSTFLHGGHLLLGLRYPVTADGHPILVEIEGIDRLFDDEELMPQLGGFRIIPSIGSKERPAGIRELDYDGQDVHIISGNLESDSKASAVIADHPEGGRARNEHWTFHAGPLRGGVVTHEAKRIRSFEDNSIEGMALEGGRVWYVHDDENIVLEVTEI